MTTATIERAQETATALRPMVDAYIIAQAHAKTWREKMDAWDAEELARYEYKTSAEWMEPGRRPMPERITRPRDAYLMDKEDYALFSEERQHFVNSLGLNLPHDHCPALCAESRLREAEWAIVQALEPFIPGISKCRNLKLEGQAIDLVVRLVVSQPGYEPPKV